MPDEYQATFLNVRVRLEELTEQSLTEQHGVGRLFVPFEVDPELDRVLC
jgi:hypothetical protein